MKEVEYEQLSFDFSVYKEKEYTKETGIELEKIIKEPKEKKEKAVKIKKKTVKKEKVEPIAEKVEPIAEKVEPIAENKIENVNSSFIKAVTAAQFKQSQELKAELASKNLEFPYIKREFMTNAEKQLYHFMRENLYLKEKITIFSKVRLGDIMDVDTRLVKPNDKAFYNIACKHVDFLIVDKYTLDIICVVELDDYTHDNDKAKERDAFVYHALQEVGIELVRIKTPIKDISKDDLIYTENIIATKYSPKCPICGGEMIVRTSRKSYNRGHRFYGCAKNFGCCGTIDID